MIAAFIRELAEYERMLEAVEFEETVLARYLFGPRPFAEVLIAQDDDTSEGVGFALFFHNFSTFLGRSGIYLEDLFVRPAHRGKGHGKALFRAIAKIARERGCARIEWAVLDWNAPSIAFYKKLGAQPLDEWTVYRLADKQIEQLAAD